MDILISVAAFLFAVGLLVTIHEFGHFWAARRLGVKVLRFSVGFGRPLWRRVDRRGTEYVVAAWPLGGYVKMLDEREGAVAAADRPFEFNRRPLAHRALIVLAGPFANFVFAVFAWTLIGLIGSDGVRPLLAEAAPDSPAAQAGIQPGDEVIAVDGRAVRTWRETVQALLERAIADDGEATLTVRDATGVERALTVERLASGDPPDPGLLLRTLGIRLLRPPLPARIDAVLPNGAAARAGLRPGDRVVASDGAPVADWSEWVERVRAYPDAPGAPDTPMRVTIERQGSGELTLDVVPDVISEGERRIGRIGASVDAGAALPPEMRVHVRYGPLEALHSGVERTWDISLLTLRMLWRIATGGASTKNLSGPVSIAQYAGLSAVGGVVAFLSFLALVSVSLGVLNLLPIPILDGGHLLFFLVEWIGGRPPSENLLAAAQRVGVGLIAILMGLALYNDFMRLL